MREVERLTLDAIAAEVGRGRAKFPKNAHMLAALTEEVGELARALLQNAPREQIEKEAIQVAAVAVRIIEEGDSTFTDWRAGHSMKQNWPCSVCGDIDGCHRWREAAP